MKNTLRTAIVAAMLGAAPLGLAGIAAASPLNDPMGICASHNDAGNCVYGYAGPSHSVSVQIPDSDPQQQDIVDYVGRTINDFEADAGPLGGLDNPLPLEELDINGTQYASAGTQTVVLKVDESLRIAPHPTTWYKAFPRDAKNAPLTFVSLFNPGARPLDVIMPIVAQQMSATAGQTITIDPAVGLDPANYQNFAITKDAVIFFFDKNEMHPAFDATEVSVPRSVIADMLKPAF